MLRTTAIRNQLLNGVTKKIIRSNTVRCISTELTRRKNKLAVTQHKGLSSILPSQWNIQIRHYADLPSHSKIPLPALSPTMETGTIVRWEKKEGDKLSEGDLLCEIETDKATMGFETPEEGYLAKILIPEGTKGVPVGQLLCIIVEKQEHVAAFKDFKDDAVAAPAPKKAAPPPAAAPAPAPAPAAAPAPAPAPAPAAAAPASDRVYASPFARRIAELRNIRLGGEGSGLYGSLKSSDISAAGAAPAPAAGHAAPTYAAPRAGVPAPAPGETFVDIPLSGMRETIAKRLCASKQTVPHYQLSTTVNVEKTLAMRVEVNKRLEPLGVKVSVNDFIIKAVAAACKRVPTVNSYWMDSFIRQFTNVDVSVAVATPTGLITPIIRNADSRGVIEISRDMKGLAALAKEGKLSPDQYQGGTVSVSNLGMYGITMFNAIINPPQSLILACGGLQEVMVPDESASTGFKTARFVTFTASADHRVIDGAVGAEWIKEFKLNMENPANIIL